jgi:Rrf2 family protein
MALNCRFAFAVHVLCTLAYHSEEECTQTPCTAMSSEQLAQMVNTNAVVIRRLLVDLHAAGLVETQRGPGGGARLARPAGEIDLAQVHRAVAGEFAPFGEHPNEPSQGCPVGRGILAALDDISQRASRAVEREYEAVTLCDVLKQVKNGPVLNV